MLLSQWQELSEDYSMGHNQTGIVSQVMIGSRVI